MEVSVHACANQDMELGAPIQACSCAELLIVYKVQGRRKVPRSGAAIYRGCAAAENFSFARSAENFLTYEETLVASRYIEGHALTLCIYTVTV